MPNNFLSCLNTQHTSQKVQNVMPPQYSLNITLCVKAAPVTTVQRILQALDALLVKPLPAAATLQHLQEPLSVLPAVAVPLFRVTAVALVP
jgi:hypothetical protein